MRRQLPFFALLVAGCVHSSLGVDEIAGRYWNGDGFWPRTLDLSEDNTFQYYQVTDTGDGQWFFSGRWTFVSPDKIELETGQTPEMIEVYVRPSAQSGIAILEPDLFEDILSTWTDDQSLRYLKRTEGLLY
jgi:hypothetical protein